MDIEQIQQFFRAVDRLDIDSALSEFEPDATLKVANLEPIVGVEPLRQRAETLMAELDGMHHQIRNIWHTPEGWVAETTATFRIRGHDDPVVVDGMTVFATDDGRVQGIRVYYDFSPVKRVLRHPDRVFEGLDATFPASDPPAWNP